MLKKKINWIIEFALLVILIVTVVPWALAETNPPLVLTAGILIDGTGAEPIQNGMVV